MTEHAVLNRLRELPTAAISAALDREGIAGDLDGIGPLPDGFPVAGPPSPSGTRLPTPTPFAYELQ